MEAIDFERRGELHGVNPRYRHRRQCKFCSTTLLARTTQRLHSLSLFVSEELQAHVDYAASAPAIEAAHRQRISSLAKKGFLSTIKNDVAIIISSIRALEQWCSVHVDLDIVVVPESEPEYVVWLEMRYDYRGSQPDPGTPPRGANLYVGEIRHAKRR